MIGVRCSIVILLMTCEAIGRRPRKSIIDVTSRALCGRVRSGQFKNGRVVIERRGLPR